MTYKEQRLASVTRFLDDNIEFLPEMLQHLAQGLYKYREACKNNYDLALRDALSTALCFLGAKRLPEKDVVRMMSNGILETMYPNGLSSAVCQGEIDFYKKYFPDRCE